MRIIALEEHVLTPALAQAQRRLDLAPPPELIQTMEAALLDLDEGRLAAMDAAGISMQVLSVAATGLQALAPQDGVALARDANDRVSMAIRRYPDRYAGLATLCLTDPGSAIAEARRAIEELGFCGVVLPGSIGDLLIDDERFSKLWTTVHRLDVPVYLHAPQPPEVTRLYYTGLSERRRPRVHNETREWYRESALLVLRLIVSGIFDRLPRLRLIAGHIGEHLPSIGHAGGMLDLLAMRLKHPVEDYLRRHFWVTTSGYTTPEPFHHSAEIIGMERMLFAADYPFGTTRRARRFLDSLALQTPRLNMLTHGNADRLFGWA